ncbi:MAG: hypothetical protein RL494_1160, partial [Bacteroidota bacterium]
ISERPAIADEKLEPGHWEMDRAPQALNNAALAA